MPPQNVKTGHPNLSQRIWYSIFPHTLEAQDERRTYRGWLNTLVLHFRPKVIQERTLRFTLTWGLGGMAAVLVILLFATGMMRRHVVKVAAGGFSLSVLGGILRSLRARARKRPTRITDIL